MDLCIDKCINEKAVNKTATQMPALDDIQDMAAIFKALGDPSRLKIVLALSQREHCVCDISVICGQSDSAVSHQLRILRSLKIVKNRREGKIVYYSLDDNHVTSLLATSLDHVRH